MISEWMLEQWGGSLDSSVNISITMWILVFLVWILRSPCRSCGYRVDLGITSVDPEISAWILVFHYGSFGNSIKLRIKLLTLELQCASSNSIVDSDCEIPAWILVYQCGSFDMDRSCVFSIYAGIECKSWDFNVGPEFPVYIQGFLVDRGIVAWITGLWCWSWDCYVKRRITADPV